jgi:hypothetical protein
VRSFLAQPGTLRAFCVPVALLAVAEGEREIVEPKSDLPSPAKGGPLSEPLPQGSILFRDDDRGFFDWLIRTRRRASSSTPPVTRRRGFPCFTVRHVGTSGGCTRTGTKLHVKLCSLSRHDLERWALKRVGSEPILCQTCFG